MRDAKVTVARTKLMRCESCAVCDGGLWWIVVVDVVCPSIFFIFFIFFIIFYVV